MSRILLIEDNLQLAQGLRNNLEIEGHVVELAGDGAAGLARIDPPPDLVILDLMLPDQSGFRVLRELREVNQSVPVLILTALGAEADKVRGLRLGADDYVTKPFGLLELMARTDALLRRSVRGGAGSPASEPLRIGAIAVYRETRTVLREGAVVALTPKEYDLLEALVRREGRVATRAELLNEVWGYPDDVLSRTVDTHVGELRRKLERNPTEPVHLLTVRKVGYRLAFQAEEFRTGS